MNTPTLWIGDGPFAKDPYVEKTVTNLIDKYKCTHAVETGTMKGITTKIKGRKKISCNTNKKRIHLEKNSSRIECAIHI